MKIDAISAAYKGMLQQQANSDTYLPKKKAVTTFQDILERELSLYSDKNSLAQKYFSKEENLQHTSKI